MQKRFSGSLSEIISCNSSVKFILIVLLCSFFILFSSDSYAFVFSDAVSDTVNSIKSKAESIASAVSATADFISGIKAFFRFLGFGTVILLASVLILSSGLSSTGLAKGKNAFFLSLITADIIWLCFKMNLGGADILSFGLYFAKTNLLILCPFILLWILKKYRPALEARLRRFLSKITGKDLAYTRKVAGASGRELAEQAVKLSSCIQENLNRSSASTGMNTDTKDAIIQIKKLITWLEKAQNNKIRKQKNETTSESR